MKKFKDFLEERFVNIGFDKNEPTEKREKHRQQIHSMIRNSYSGIGGYKGLGSGSKEESDEIHSDISKSMIKGVKRNGKLVSVKLYKDSHGRKSVATGHDGTDEGKSGVKKIMQDDIKQKRSWAELSGAPAAIYTKLGAPKIPVKKMRKLLQKKLEPTTGSSYTRDIAGKKMEKTGFGYPKED